MVVIVMYPYQSRQLLRILVIDTITTHCTTSKLVVGLEIKDADDNVNRNGFRNGNANSNSNSNVTEQLSLLLSTPDAHKARLKLKQPREGTIYIFRVLPVSGTMKEANTFIKNETVYGWICE